MNGWRKEGKVRNERLERGRKREMNGWREEGKVRNELVERGMKSEK